MNFAERLKKCRLNKKTTQKQMASFLGMEERSYQNYEYGNREPNFEIAIRIADYFDVSLDYLVGRSDDHSHK